jgi:peptidoglycan/LPS O-acetylase OafA/YrhL
MAEQASVARRFRPDVEGLRAVAVVAVMAFHAGVPLFSGGYVGVDAFFVLSGFLITGLLVAERSSTGRITLTRFYGRRVRRLLPAAALVVVVTLVGSFALGGPLELYQTSEDARAVAGFVANFRFADAIIGYFGRSRPSAFEHYWSLAVEEQFYFVWPSLLLLLGFRAPSGEAVRRRVITFLAVLVPVSFVWCVVQTSAAPRDAFFLLPARAWELGVGALLAVVPMRALGRRSVTALSIVGAGLIVSAVVLLDDTTAFPGWAAALPVIGTALLLLVGAAAPDAVLPRALSNRVMQRIGRYSYSLYLWHFSVLIVAAMAKPRVLESWPKGTLVVLASVPPAIASFHLLEDSVRRSRWLSAPSRRSLVLGAALIAFTLTASAVGLRLPRLSTDRSVAAGSRHATDFVPANLTPKLVDIGDTFSEMYQGACEVERDTPEDEPCFFGNLHSPTTVVLLGDSHAGMWFSAVRAFADEHDWRLEVDVTDGCSAALDDDVDTCDRHRDAVLARLQREQPAVVVLADFARRNSTDVGVSEEASYERWRRGIADTLEQLRGSTTMLIAETPEPAGSADECLADHVDDVRPCEPDPDDPWFHRYVRAGRAAADASGAQLVDLTPLVCWDDRCPVIVGTTPVYYDAHHLTEEYVLSITDDVVTALDTALATTPGGEHP